MKDLINALTSKLHRRQIIGELLQMIAVSLLMGTMAYVFSKDGLLGPALIGGSFFIGSVALGFLLGRFNKINPREVIRYLDRTYPFAEESASLLIKDESNSMLESWQKEKVTGQFRKHISDVQLPHSDFKKSLGMAGLWLAVSVILFASKPLFQQAIHSVQVRTSEEVTADRSLAGDIEIPEILSLDIFITNPEYTGLRSRQASFENIQVPKNAEIRWRLKASGVTHNADMIFAGGDTAGFRKNGDHFEFAMDANQNQIYQIALTGADTTVYSSYKSLEVIADQPPGFVIHKPTEKRNFISPQKKSFDIEALIGDDYGVKSAKIKATLARGSGENVRFRESEFSFDRITGLDTKETAVFSRLYADSLEMEPGDELYFYITATDNKPAPQSSRSETYFIIYQDSGEDNTVEVAGLGVDLLPEYFRSQRQIIIDTEQLLADSSGISKTEFDRRSQNIGYDQNLLRQRYGAYLGQEDEMGGMQETVSDESEGVADAHDHEGEEVIIDDGHDHEADINEMGLENAESTAASVIPDEFFHDHGAAEMNTLFAESPRALLKQALDNMWNAELYLRTKRPHEALPYEYAALEYLKAVQQANRQYTRKAGYELPPIDEGEKRLTGSFDDFASPEGKLLTTRPRDPLERLQLLIKDPVISPKTLANEAQTLITEANVSDADRLYLLNRFRTIENEGRNEQVEQQILSLISGLSDQVRLDPVPARRPVLQNRMEPDK